MMILAALSMPLRVKQQPAQSDPAEGGGINRDSVDFIMSMGIPEKKAIKGLRECVRL